MAESYFELLTEQHGMPAKPFDPVGEIKRLRTGLALRMQAEPPPKEVNHTTTSSPVAEISEPVALETVVNTVSSMTKKLAVRRRARFYRTLPHTIFFQEKRHHIGEKKQIHSIVIEYLTDPQNGKLEILSACLTALGIIGITFGVLSFCRGWESDISLGTMVSVSGFAIIGIGLGGRFLASHSECA